MATKRMFSHTIVSSDAFLEMPLSSQALYFHLVMTADDEGFVNPRKVLRIIGANVDDLNILIGKRFVLIFESGIVVIKHWAIHNVIRMDRWHPTVYQDEKKNLLLKDNNTYTELTPTERQPNANLRRTESNLIQSNLIKSNLIKRGDRTPSQIAKDFFNKEEKQKELIEVLTDKYGQKDFFLKEVQKFVEYWTEPNKSGTKQRWELQNTFEVSRRMKNWLNRSKQYATLSKEDKKGVSI